MSTRPLRHTLWHSIAESHTKTAEMWSVAISVVDFLFFPDQPPSESITRHAELSSCVTHSTLLPSVKAPDGPHLAYSFDDWLGPVFGGHRGGHPAF